MTERYPEYPLPVKKAYTSEVGGRWRRRKAERPRMTGIGREHSAHTVEAEHSLGTEKSKMLNAAKQLQHRNT